MLSSLLYALGSKGSGHIDAQGTQISLTGKPEIFFSFTLCIPHSLVCEGLTLAVTLTG